MKTRWISAAMIATTLAGQARAGDALTPQELEGGYTIVSGEQEGRPDEKAAGTTVRWTKDRFVVTAKDKSEVYGGTYTLAAAEGGATKITMTSKLGSENQTAEGLVKKEGETLTLIYALPGGATPTKFKTAAKQNLFVMKNMKK